MNVQCADGRSPLNHACLCGQLLPATLLIDAGADMTLVDGIGQTALDMAEWHVEHDAAPPAAGAEPPSAAQLQEHRDLVALLKARGAP